MTALLQYTIQHRTVLTISPRQSARTALAYKRTPIIIFKKFDNVDSNVWFKLSSTGLRGHDYKLFKQPCCLNKEVF